MNVESLKKIIYETVVKAMREEFREILVEAVDLTTNQRPEQPKTKQIYQERNINRANTKTSLEDILQETAQNMRREDYQNLTEQSSPRENPVSDFPDIISRAAAIFNLSKQKDLERHGI